MARAIRAVVGDPAAAASVRDRARALGLLGWVRADDGRLHAEGPRAALDALVADVDATGIEAAKVEGHEQFALRGVSAGVYVITNLKGSDPFMLGLEVGGAMRWWSVPKEPSMDPAVKRFAVEAEGPPEWAGAETWDAGDYEQGGRVPWPEALERGHAVFVLHGTRLRGGFALQRTGRGWLLVKRRDEHARPGADG